MYANFWKRVFDFCLSLLALTVLLPLLIILTAVGAIAMRGNPFFMQQRPGRNEKIFKLIKFRTMDNRKGSDGKLLPDEERLGGYGRFLRATSLDELPELINIIKGDMALVGPRPLLVKYLPLYDEQQRHRHDVRPGLTGYAQAHGRNATDWDSRLKMDVEYVSRITFAGDIRILLDTVLCVLKHEGISAEGQATMEDFEDYVREKRRIKQH